MRRLILKSFQSPGDIVMLTAAVRDLHLAHPDKFQTDVRTSADALWQENPHLVSLKEGEPGVETLDMHYPLIHQSNHRPYHFIHGYVQYLEQKLSVPVPVSAFRGDIHLSAAEKAMPVPGANLGVPEHFWIIVAGGKNDFTAKWWNPECYQQVVDHFRDRITFVQCGEAGHWHPPLKGVVNLIGKTGTRDFIRLMYHADGVLCPVTFAMHLAAAVEMKPRENGSRSAPPTLKHRPCVVIAGGREPAHWEAYTHHQFLSTNGALPCCLEGGCWKSRCQLVGDGDAKDRNDVCTNFVQLDPKLRIPKCMDMISAEDVIRRIELYYDGGVLTYGQIGSVSVAAGVDLTVENGAMAKGSGGNGHSVRRAGGVSPLIVAAAGRSEEMADGGVHSTVRTGRNAHTADSTDRIVRPTTGRTGLETHATTSVSFHHGLGDAAYFSALIAMCTKRGYPIEVECTPDKRILFEAAGATTIASGAKSVHHWGYPSGSTHSGHGHFWQGSKMGHNISEPPFPNIGSKTELWDEYCQTKVDVLPLIPAVSVRTNHPCQHWYVVGISFPWQWRTGNGTAEKCFDGADVAGAVAAVSAEQRDGRRVLRGRGVVHGVLLCLAAATAG